MSILSEYHAKVASLDRTSKSRLPVLEWLVSMDPDDRRTGRTTLLALAFIGASIRNRVVWLKVFDHHGSTDERDTQIIRKAVSEIAPSASLSRNMRLHCQERAYPSDRGHPEFSAFMSSLKKDYLAVCRSAVQHGIDIDWMKEQIDDMVVRKVMIE